MTRCCISAWNTAVSLQLLRARRRLLMIPDDEGRGVLEFKQGFNGYVEELPGEFVLPVKPVAYAMKQFAHKLLSR